MENYQAFGLILKSELALPYLRPFAPDASDLEFRPDLEIRLGHVDENGLAGAVQAGRHMQSGPDRLWLHVPRIARFLITGGDRIQVDPEPGADEQSVRLFLLGSCLGAVMHQRGRLILHGSALRFGDQCVVFVGKSGAGKSTLAAALNLRGHEILADDLSVVDEQCRVQPGFPQIKLWADAVRKLGVEKQALTRIRLQVDKYAVPLGNDFCDTPLPLAAVYVLNSHNKDEVLFKPVSGMAKLNPLKNHTYRFNHLKGLGMQARHMQLCGKLANQVKVTQMTRPTAGFRLDEMMERVESDMQSALQPALAAA